MSGMPAMPSGSPGVAGDEHSVSTAPKERIFLPQTRGERVASALWALVRAVCFRATPPAMNAWRVFLLRRFGAAIGRGVFIHQSARIDYPWNLSIGDQSTIEHGVILNCMGRIDIGHRCRVSQYAHLCAGTHKYEEPAMSILRRSITIGAGVWIAADAFVGPGVTIGEGALLAARSSAFGDLPADQICVGEPARAKKPRFSE